MLRTVAGRTLVEPKKKAARRQDVPVRGARPQALRHDQPRRRASLAALASSAVFLDGNHSSLTAAAAVSIASKACQVRAHPIFRAS
jgi:hypothetical protein